MSIEWQLIKKDIKTTQKLSNYKVKCKRCGHVLLLTRQNKKICSHCGYFVFKNEKDEFNYRMAEMLKKGNKE